MLDAHVGSSDGAHQNFRAYTLLLLGDVWAPISRMSWTDEAASLYRLWMARQGFQALSLLSNSSLALTKNGKGGEWRLFSMLTLWSIQMMDLIFSLRNFYEGLCHSPPLPKSTTLIKLSREFGSSISSLILFQIYCSDINLICYIICSGSWTHFLFFK